MLTLFHAPQSRSSAIVTLIDEMAIGDWVDIVEVTIPRIDGTGRRDPANPHPEGKAPCLVHDGTIITERGAIMLTLTSMFPDAGMAPKPGSAQWSAYLTWLFWYGSVMEPVLIMAAAGVSHPWLHAAVRGVPEVTARLAAALEHQPFLLGDTISAADLLVHSPYAWFTDATPDVPSIRDWVARCQARPAVARTKARDVAAMSVAA
jgi:glutathione S-transferase